MPLSERDVFVNCPFDADYRPLFDAIVFVIVRAGLRVRCALEVDDGGESRFAKICGIVRESTYAVHDISRTELNVEQLPRFNMPFELGLFLGAKYSTRAGRKKKCVIFDREPYRYQKFLSDIAGQDIHAHGGSVATLIAELSGWIRTTIRGVRVPGGQHLVQEYAAFQEALPGLCRALMLQASELTFSDFNAIAVAYVDERGRQN